MNKIIKSILTLSVVASVAVFATSAYFSDTEKSENNVFTAGSIDLKVDSDCHYNGLTCIDDVWQNVCKPEGDNLIANGSFEDPLVTNTKNWDIFPNGTTGLEWTVEWETDVTTFKGYTRPEPSLQELHRGVNSWTPQDGDQYVELDSDWFGPDDNLTNEPAKTRIYQNVPTVIGEKYLLTYFYSPRPGESSSENELKVRINGSQVDTQSESGGNNTDWEEYSYEFVAGSSSTKVEFAAGGPNNSLGVFLDNVSLRHLKCSDYTEIVGESCDCQWPEMDLTAEKFFTYDDIKPGDYGENTISMKVYNNDAYACMYFENLQDDENGLIEPEENEGGDTSSDIGELSQDIDVLMWYDDGDNILEDGEDWLFDGPKLASEVFDHTYPLAVPGNGVVYEGGVKNYVGVAWCAGNMIVSETDNPEWEITCDGEPMGNRSQTDRMMVDVRFFVEQTRHNDQFSCPRPEVSPLPTLSPSPTPTPDSGS